MRAPLRIAAILAVPVLGLAELGAHLWFASRPPAFDEWSAVVDTVRITKQDGDLVVIAPAWADPAARRVLGDDLMPLRDVARPDESRYAHAVEVSILGEHARELAGWREEGRTTAGKFLVRRLANPAPAHVMYDFVDHARPPFADVRGTEAVTTGETPKPPAQPAISCTWNPHAAVSQSGPFGHPVFPSERFECPGGPFFNVGVTVIGDEELRPRRCLWSHPFAHGEIVTRFHDVPLGKVVHGHGGIYWIVEREKRGAPVTLTVRVDGDTVGSFVHKDGDGWAPFEIDLGAHAGAPKAEVEVAVSSPSFRDRHFCWEADTR
jgi:hypothetical protein